MAKHPYLGLPAYAHWPRAVARIEPSQMDPVVTFPFRIGQHDVVATAGSCFAQHISRHLAGAGFRYYIAEPAHGIMSTSVAAEFGYGTYSARYGNIYTSRQLVQLFDRAYGQFVPVEDVWAGPKGRLIDPFRPTIQPNGFASMEEYAADRDVHFAAVRNIFETVDYFVFTLGLTEGWYATKDGAAFPVCPGVSGGEFDASLHGFKNLGVADVTADMEAFLARLRSVNSNARVILTVSPVPLMATIEDRHVLQSTTLSKSLLRVVCDDLQRRYENVAYFPSYEIITGAYSRGRYFASDLRSVTEEGVSHVMRLFLRHATTAVAVDAPAAMDSTPPADAFLAHAQSVVEVTCDEEALRDL